MDFATSKNQYPAKKDLLRLDTCDGSAPDNTLEAQLIREGIIESKWSHADEDTPGSIFFWFKHVAAPLYVPDFCSFTDSRSRHCGICYHKIRFVYHYNLADPGIDVVNLTGELDVRLPPDMVSGSECIHLADEFMAIRNWMIANGFFNGMIRFSHGRIDVDSLIVNWSSWKLDSIALPLQWFYFRPAVRQFLAGREPLIGGRNVFMPFEDRSVIRRIRRATVQGGNVRAKTLFQGMDDYARMVADINCDHQSSHSCAYALLTRDDARLIEKRGV